MSNELNFETREILTKHAIKLIVNEPSEIQLVNVVRGCQEDLEVAIRNGIREEFDFKTITVLRKLGLLKRFTNGSFISIKKADCWFSAKSALTKYRMYIKAGDSATEMPFDYFYFDRYSIVWSLLAELEQKQAERRAHMTKRLLPYKKLINQSTTLEEVLSLWPEAINAPLPDSMSTFTQLDEKDIEQINKDTQTRSYYYEPKV